MTTIRVVLADDHTIVRAGIRNTLESILNLKMVGEAGNGPELLALLRDLRPDLALIDVTMPQFDPIVAVRRICSEYPELKVLIISAYDDAVYVRGLLTAGAHGYHLKDQPLRDLSLAVERVLQGERWISSPLLDKLVTAPLPADQGETLSARQRDILELLQQGRSNQEIASILGLSAKTVENHLTRLYRQLGVANRLEAIAHVMQQPERLALSAAEAARDCDGPVVHTPYINILLVDDNARYRNRLRQMVAHAHPQATIYEADGNRAVVQLVKRITVHLALVDVVLGDENGIQCARALHAISPATRIILISAYPDAEFRRSGLEAGACAFLDKKSLDIPTLRHMIGDIVSL
jgi:DNA-binding NarL/FixJ family response regulator